MGRCHTQVTLKCILAVIALIAAFFGGVVSNRVMLERARSELDSVRRELKAERAQRELSEMADEFSSMVGSARVSPDRLSKLVDRYNAYLRNSDQNAVPQSAQRLRELERDVAKFRQYSTNAK